MSHVDNFGMDTITLAGSLNAKLAAVKAAGFSQIMINARDLVGHEGGVDAAIDVVRSSELRVTGFQVLRDFEGLSGHLHDYKIDIAKAMLQMCHRLGSQVLLVCSTTSQHATDDLESIDTDKIFLVQLSDFMWQDAATFADRMATARTFRVFPGEGVHSETVAELVHKLDQAGYRGDYSFEVFNDDYQQIPIPVVCQRAYNSAAWISQNILRKGAPLPAWTRDRPIERTTNESF